MATALSFITAKQIILFISPVNPQGFPGKDKKIIPFPIDQVIIIIKCFVKAEDLYTEELLTLCDTL